MGKEFHVTDGGLIRHMTTADLNGVLDIECAAYEFPWSDKIFRDCLRVGYPSWIYEKDGRLCGYGVMSVAAGEAHILNLCVNPPEQGQGVGKSILRVLMSTARALSVQTIFLEVRQSNHRAQALYEQFGFNEIGTRRNYYPHTSGREDAMVLGYEMTAKSLF